jgi:hypothetical protein
LRGEERDAARERGVGRGQSRGGEGLDREAGRVDVEVGPGRVPGEFPATVATTGERDEEDD